MFCSQYKHTTSGKQDISTKARHVITYNNHHTKLNVHFITYTVLNILTTKPKLILLQFLNCFITNVLLWSANVAVFCRNTYVTMLQLLLNISSTVFLSMGRFSSIGADVPVETCCTSWIHRQTCLLTKSNQQPVDLVPELSINNNRNNITPTVIKSSSCFFSLYTPSKKLYLNTIHVIST